MSPFAFIVLVILSSTTDAFHNNDFEAGSRRELQQQQQCADKTGCGGVGSLEFCGEDQKCWPYSCQNLYRYGDKTFSGNLDGAPLTCEPFPSGTSSTLAAAYSTVFACAQTNSTEAALFALKFNEVCTAPLNRNSHIFTCYQLSNTTNVTEYIDRTVNTAGFGCPDGTNQSTPPLYYYAVRWGVTQRGPPLNQSGYTGLNLDPNPTSQFDPTAAISASMSSILYNFGQPTPEISTPAKAPVSTASNGVRLRQLEMAFVSVLLGTSVWLLFDWG